MGLSKAIKSIFSGRDAVSTAENRAADKPKSESAAQKPMTPTSAMLNLGCGRHFHPTWMNMDIVSFDPAVIQYDIQSGLPFADGSFQVVYHSHVLEHLPRPRAAAFLKECNRVLKPGGILRVVVPDLETIARLYVKYLDGALQGDLEAAQRHEWMTLELLDQMVREQSGGEVLKFWKLNPMPAEDFITERVGQELKVCRELLAAQPPGAAEPPPPSEAEIARFRQGGEVHKWMYDRVSLRALLERCGFTDATACRANESRIADFNNYLLDVNADGSTRKPDSFFMEARKP